MSPGYGFSAVEAGHVLYVMNGREGMEPGSFITALITAMAKADQPNRARLGHVYPGYMDAVDAYQNDPNGVVKLREAFLTMTKGGSGD